VKGWQFAIEERGLSPATIYGAISRVSAFYAWAMTSGRVTDNPAILARPKSPRPYSTKSTKSLDDDELKELAKVVRSRAESGDIQGERDYAMLLLFILTGLRRTEVCGLRLCDVKLDNGHGLVITCRVKGGQIVTREVNAQN